MTQEIDSTKETAYEKLYKANPSIGPSIERAARVAIKYGAASTEELNFFLKEFPQVIADWMEMTPNAKALMEEFKHSRMHLSYALAMCFHLDYDHIYRALKHSPLRPRIGDFTVDAQPAYFVDEDPTTRVRVVAPEKVDLTDIRKMYRISQDFQNFSQDAEGYLGNLQTEITEEQDIGRKRVLQLVHDYYREVNDAVFPRLRTQLLDQHGMPRRDKSGRDILFPSPHQKAAIVKAAEDGSVAVFDGTGSGKTGIGVGLSERIGAKRVLVICPASVKDVWRGKISEYYQENPGVIKVDSQNKHKVANGEMYTLVNYELLINRSSNGKRPVDILSPLSYRLLESPFDLLILDEAHYINNENGRSEAVLELARRIDRRLILTATPLRNSVDDLGRIAHLLSPNEFTTPDSLRRLGKSGVPVLCELLATKTIRRKTEELLDLPPFCPENGGEIKYTQLELNPTQRAIYDTILDDSSLRLFGKLRLLRLAAIDHNLVCGKYSQEFDEKSSIKELQRAFKSWKRQQENNSNLAFDSNYLVTHGYRHLFIGAHFHFQKGIDQLIQTYGSNEIKENWKGVVESTKFREICQRIKQRLTMGEKVVVFSSHFVKGILREITDDVTGEAILEDLYSFLQREFPGEYIGRIDGDITTNSRKGEPSMRELERQRWQNDPNYRILLTSLPSSSLGIDYSINDGVTKGVSVLGLDLPYTKADLWQMIARVFRFGQRTPVNAEVIEALQSVDQGIRALIDKKGEIEIELFDGVSPTEIQRQVFERSKAASDIIEYVTSPKREMEKKFNNMRSRGVSANGAYLETIVGDGRTVGEALAELYSRYWEYTHSGHTARLLQQVIDGLRADTNNHLNLLVDAGSGPLVMERVIRQESSQPDGLRVISVDMNRHMLENGAASLQQMGHMVDRSNLINKPMSETGLRDSICDAVVCSLAFHYSNSSEDRGKVLAEANRILRLGGYYFITLPETYLTPEQYKAFAIALRKFGFEIDRNISGKAKATDYKDVPFEIWLVAARKVGMPQGDQLSMQEFHFNFEGPKISTYKGVNDKDEKPSKKQERLVKHEKFVILDPEKNFKSKGSPEQILARLGLKLDEEIMRRYGWKMEAKDTKEGPVVVIKK